MVALHSLRYRIAATIFLLEVIMMTTVLWIVLGMLSNSARDQVEELEEVASGMLAQLSRPALLTEEYSQLQPYMERMRSDPHLLRILLLDSSRRVVAGTDLQYVGQSAPDYLPGIDSYWRVYEIHNAAEHLGTLAIQFSSLRIIKAERQARTTGILIAATGMVVIAFFGLFFGYLLTLRLNRLTQAAMSMAQGDLGVRTGLKGKDEVSGLGQAFDVMADRVQTERDALQRANAHLEERVAQRTAALEAANRELESFAYSVSHDLRAPLRGIDGFSQAVLEDYSDRLDATGKDYLNRVRKASQRMGQLIDDLLRLSKVNQAPLQLQEVDLGQLAEEIIQQLRETDPQRSVRIAIEPDMRVQGDPGLMRAVMQNLLGNAWKFTARTADARIDFCREPGDSAREPVFCVSDNGTGFDMAHAGKLFSPFQRLHHRDEFEGSGIGLATVQRIIHRHGGRIWAQGSPGAGARFCFSLPATHRTDFPGGTTHEPHNRTDESPSC